jgi:UDP-N-acetylglucosamine--N-acetylmuramyl-(pentapeptide) pyrophosphoryl-undecaprenol N-acetylglucosamine transferase
MGKKRILFATGGTGGHIFPAVATACEIAEKMPEADLLFAGGRLATNQFLQQNRFPIEEISSAPFARKSLFSFGKAATLGFFQSCQLLRRHNPQLMIAFGSYYTFPLLLAARFMRVPFVLHEANAAMGRVNKLFAPKAACSALFFPSAAEGLAGHTSLSCMPIRWKNEEPLLVKEEAYRYFGLDREKRTILVFGGSQGASFLNKMMGSIPLNDLKSDCQIVHITGLGQEREALEGHYQAAGITAKVVAFERNMQYAWAAADLAICRAGGSTIAEAIEFGVPMLLIPYPFAKDDHQKKNAFYVVEKLKIGKMLLENETTAENFTALLQQILCTSLQEMQQNMISARAWQKSLPSLADIGIQYLEKLP